MFYKMDDAYIDPENNYGMMTNAYAHLDSLVDSPER
jgi:hypothetical protein